MNEQLSLLEMPPPRMSQYSLILAIFPDPHTAQHLTNFGNTLCRKYGLRGRVRPASHLHVSLPFPNQKMDKLETFVRTIDQVCKPVTAVARPFEIIFNRVMSFRGKPGNRPVVLVNDNHGKDGVMGLYGSLCTEFAKYTHSPHSIPKFVPHVTLLYDQRELASEPVEPVYWAVKEIVLVLSEVGATKYHRLGSWLLGGSR